MTKEEHLAFVLWTKKVHPIPTADWARKKLLPLMFETGLSAEELLLLNCSQLNGECPHTTDYKAC